MATFERPCLVDIDTQVDFVKPSGALYVPGAEQLLPIWRQLTEFGQANSLPMLASVDAHAKDDPELRQYPPHCIKGTVGQQKVAETLTSKYIVVPNDRRETTIDFEAQVILEKQELDVFSNVHAEEIFTAVACSSFVVYGVTTDLCVRHAVLGLLSRGCRVHVISDAIQPLDRQAGERALAEMANAGAAFIQSVAFLEKARHQVSMKEPQKRS